MHKQTHLVGLILILLTTVAFAQNEAPDLLPTEEIETFEEPYIFCEDLGGEICEVYETCEGKWVYADDSGSRCCAGVCYNDAYCYQGLEDEVLEGQEAVYKAIEKDIDSDKESYNVGGEPVEEDRSTQINYQLAVGVILVICLVAGILLFYYIFHNRIRKQV